MAIVTCPARPASGHHLCLLLVVLGVEYVVFDAAELEHAAQEFGDLHRSGTHEYRPALGHEGDDFLDHGIVLLSLGLVYLVVPVLADDRPVGRDNDNVEFVDAPEFARLRFGRTGHAGQLVILSLIHI